MAKFLNKTLKHEIIADHIQHNNIKQDCYSISVINDGTAYRCICRENVSLN